MKLSFFLIKTTWNNIHICRFRSALKEQPWKGIRNALREGNSCPHQNMLLDTYKGSEDCLFLNVYTKHLPNKDRYKSMEFTFIFI